MREARVKTESAGRRSGESGSPVTHPTSPTTGTGFPHQRSGAGAPRNGGGVGGAWHFRQPARPRRDFFSFS